MTSLHRFLIDYEMAMLRALADNRGVTLGTNRQKEAVDRLSMELLQPLSVRTAVAHLSSQARGALESLLVGGGQMRVPQFTRRFGQVRAMGPGRLEREAPWQKPANPVEELWYAGLIFRAFSEDEYGLGEFFFVPDDLFPLLPRPQAAPSTFAVERIPAPTLSVDGEPAVVRDLFAYLSHLQNHDVRPHASGHLGQHDLAFLRMRLIDADDGRLAFLQHLAGRLGFVTQQGPYLRLESAQVRQWLVATPFRQLAILQDAWRNDLTWNDLCHVPSLVCDQQTPWRNDPVATRQASLHLLARCPVDAWWSLPSFVTAVRDTHPDFQRPDGDYASWYIRDAATGDYFSGFESWERVEGALITYLLTGPLCWLGVVATATDDGTTICHLTQAGAHLLDLVAGEQESPPPPPIVVSPDLSVDLPGPVSLYIRFQLERFAELESLDPCRYRLTVGSLARALARDIRIDQMLAFLRQASDGQVPLNVVGQLEMWAGRFGQVRVEEVALLTVKSERVLKDLMVLPETRSLVDQVLSPTTALVRKQDLPRFRKALRSLGYLLPEEAGGDLAERG